MAGEVKIGLKCKAYAALAGDLSSPTWSEMSKIGNVNFSGTRKEATIAERGSDDELVEVGQRQTEASFRLTRRPGDPVFDGIQAAFENGDVMAFAFMDGAIATAGSHGWQGDCYVTGWDDDQSNEGEGVDVTVKPAASYSQAPGFVTVGP